MTLFYPMHQLSAKPNDDDSMSWVTDDDDDFEKDEQQQNHHRVQINAKKTKTDILLEMQKEHSRSLKETLQLQKQQQENFKEIQLQLQKQQENFDKLLKLMMTKMDIIIDGLGSDKKTINQPGTK